MNIGWPTGLARAGVLVATALCLLAPQAGAAERFTVSADGTEVTDHRTGLVWRRCSAGQAFANGTCTGSPGRYTHEQALAHAASQPGWRLPNVRELSSIVDTGRSAPSIDVVAFPGTPSDWFWTSSPFAGPPGYAWYVDFDDGVVNFYYRIYTYHVRLVR